MTLFSNQAMRLAGVGLLGLGLVGAASAKLTDEEIAQLGMTGTPLTPVGATRAGNAAGTIPEWTGGITSPPANFKPGGAWVDPYPDDKELFTITAQNYEQYKENLLPGQMAMFKQYPDSFRMHVYPTRRSASYPDWFVQKHQGPGQAHRDLPRIRASRTRCACETSSPVAVCRSRSPRLPRNRLELHPGPLRRYDHGGHG